MNERLAKVLLNYRITPHSTTGMTPSELLVGRILRTRLKPQTAERVESKQLKQKESHDVSAKHRVFRSGDTVLVKNFGSG